MSDAELIKNEAEHRYEIHVDGERVGFITYRADDALVVLPHTEVDPKHGGRGYAGQLTEFALNDVRASGRNVVPTCPYIRSWIDKHPDFADLVADR